MAGLAPVELTADCTACGLEAGCVEVYDAREAVCRFGLPATTRCKLCAAASEGVFHGVRAKPLHEIPANRCPACIRELTPAAIDDRCCAACGVRASMAVVSPPASFLVLGDLEAALDAWAQREQFPNRQALVSATFAEPDVAKIFDALRRKVRIEILADPFANMGVRTTSGTTRDTAPAVPAVKAEQTLRSVEDLRPPVFAPPPLVTTDDPRHQATTEPMAGRPVQPASAPTPTDLPLEAPPRSAPPRAIVYPLISVIAADGEIHPEERALVDRFLQCEGLPPLADDEFCVHHPSEVAHFVPKERREDVVKLMCESAAVDGMPDESERRVIRAYATAWNVDDEKVDFWMWGYETMNTSLARQLFLKLRRFVLSARWSDTEGA